MEYSSESFFENIPVSIIMSFLLIDPDYWEKILSVSCLAASIQGANEEESFGTQQSLRALLFTPSFLYGPQLSAWSAVLQSRNPQFVPIQKPKSHSGWRANAQLQEWEGNVADCQHLKEIFQSAFIALLSDQFPEVIIKVNSGVFGRVHSIKI